MRVTAGDTLVLITPHGVYHGIGTSQKLQEVQWTHLADGVSLPKPPPPLPEWQRCRSSTVEIDYWPLPEIGVPVWLTDGDWLALGTLESVGDYLPVWRVWGGYAAYRALPVEADRMGDYTPPQFRTDQPETFTPLYYLEFSRMPRPPMNAAALKLANEAVAHLDALPNQVREAVAPDTRYRYAGRERYRRDWE